MSVSKYFEPDSGFSEEHCEPHEGKDWIPHQHHSHSASSNGGMLMIRVYPQGLMRLKQKLPFGTTDVSFRSIDPECEKQKR